MTTHAIETRNISKHTSPLSHATIVGPWIYTLGTGGIDYKTGKIVSSDIAEQTAQSLRNLTDILAACGATLGDVVKANVYLTDINDYQRVNEVYLAHMGTHRPARCCVGVATLPAEEKMKIEMIAYLKSKG